MDEISPLAVNWRGTFGSAIFVEGFSRCRRVSTRRRFLAVGWGGDSCGSYGSELFTWCLQVFGGEGGGGGGNYCATFGSALYSRDNHGGRLFLRILDILGDIRLWVGSSKRLLLSS